MIKRRKLTLADRFQALIEDAMSLHPMIQAHDLTAKIIAKKLGTTPKTVSFYLHSFGTSLTELKGNVKGRQPKPIPKQLSFPMERIVTITLQQAKALVRGKESA